MRYLTHEEILTLPEIPEETNKLFDRYVAALRNDTDISQLLDYEIPQRMQEHRMRELRVYAESVDVRLIEPEFVYPKREQILYLHDGSFGAWGSRNPNAEDRALLKNLPLDIKTDLERRQEIIKAEKDVWFRKQRESRKRLDSIRSLGFDPWVDEDSVAVMFSERDMHRLAMLLTDPDVVDIIRRRYP